jgi:hypothetical protein
MDIVLLEPLDDGRKRVRCESCEALWVHGTEVAPSPQSSFERARQRFPTPEMVESGRCAHVEALKDEFLRTQPVQDPEVTEYWARYQAVFSPEGLQNTPPQLLKDFANNGIGANPGNMSVFNSAWNEMGTEAAAERVRETIHYLLYGPARIPREDRLTDLIEDHSGRYMKGFKEALLTRVLCIMHPDTFLPILNYDGVGTGKRHITEAVFGLRMPPKDRTTMQVGRLIYWSNDLLRELVGEGFDTMQHAAAFLWWAKDQPRSKDLTEFEEAFAR